MFLWSLCCPKLFPGAFYHAAVGTLGLARGGGVPDVEMVSDRTCFAEAGATGVWQGSSAGGSSLGLLMGEFGTGRSSIMPSSKGLLGGLCRMGRGLGLRGDTTSSWGWSSKARVSPIDN